MTEPNPSAAPSDAADHRLGILARRRIEAEIIKPIYEIMKREFGIERAQAVIAEAVRGAAVDAGQSFAAQEPGGTSIASFVALQVLWEKDDALDVEVRREDAGHYDYDVHRCGYAEMYHAMGLGEIGHLLSCARDDYFIARLRSARGTDAHQHHHAGRQALRFPLSNARREPGGRRPGEQA